MQVCIQVLKHCPGEKGHRRRILGLSLGADASEERVAAGAVWAMVANRLRVNYDLEFAEEAAATEAEDAGFDAVVVLPPATASSASSHLCQRLVVHGGVALLVAAPPSWSSQYWLEPAVAETAAPLVAVIRRVACDVNSAAGAGEVDTAIERRLLETIAVRRSVAESRSGKLSPSSHRDAVRALRANGVCVLPRYFDAALIRRGGAASVQDTLEAAQRLSRDKGIELLPAPVEDADFDKYAAQDAQVVRGHQDKFTLRRGEHLAAFAAAHEEALRHDPHLVAVLVEAVLPAAPDEAGRDENKGSAMLRRSATVLESHELGAVVSLPGDSLRPAAEDQKLHVDTEHLYEHVHLPPHYLVAFMQALASAEEERDLAVGQTAFIAGSHFHEAAQARSARGTERAHAARYRPLKKEPVAGGEWAAAGGGWPCAVVRPHCRAGDVVLFDARIMHFGIANSSGAVHRPMLFINYSRPWFSDFQPGGEIIVRHKLWPVAPAAVGR